MQAVHPGLIVAAGLGFRPASREERTGLDRLQRIVVVALLWWAAPVVLVLLWWRAMPAHEEWLTLAGAASLFVAGFVGWKSFAEARHRLGDGAEPRPRRPAWALLGVGLVVLSWARTEGGLDHYVDRAIAWWNRELPERALRFGDDTYALVAEEDARLDWIAAQWWIPQALLWEHAHFWDYPLWLVSLAPVDLEGVEMIPRPDDWRNQEVAHDAFRDAWCDRKDHGEMACADFIAERGDDFDAAWDAERAATFDNLQRLLRPGADLRAARLQGAFAPRIDLTNARLAGADLSEARLERAVLSEARLAGADLSRARLEGAELSEARLERANLSEARLAGADLAQARLEGANLARARLEGADLGGARLAGAVLRAADFTGTTLNQGRIDGAIGDADTVLPRDAETGAQLYVWSCWEEPPPTLDETLAISSDRMPQELREQWLCNGRARKKIGRPAPEPEETPENGSGAAAAPAP